MNNAGRDEPRRFPTCNRAESRLSLLLLDTSLLFRVYGLQYRVESRVSAETVNISHKVINRVNGGRRARGHTHAAPRDSR